MRFSFKHKTAKACTPEQWHFKKWSGITTSERVEFNAPPDTMLISEADANNKKFFLRFAPDICHHYLFRRHCHGVYRSTVKQRWAIILRYIILV